MIEAALTRPGLPVVVVGGGYTGLEAVENLVARGASVTLVQRGEQLLAPLDVEMAAPILAEVRAHGVDVRLGVRVQEVAATGVTLSDGSVVPAEFIVDASGVIPEVGLASAAGIRIGATGGIAVDASSALKSGTVAQTSSVAGRRRDGHRAGLRRGGGEGGVE